MLQSVFTNLCSKYTAEDTALLWQEIEQAYTGKKRYYHNLIHLENMYNELLSCKEDIKDWDSVLFALFYHDIVYKATSKDNEAKSAETAIKRLVQINVHSHKLDKCHELIIATKSHIVSNNNDTNLFTDADLSILGYPWEKYEAYYKQVRKEYSYYPDLLYNPGRKKVLQHFLAMDSIFKTLYFREKYEAKARTNLQMEMSIL